jgi:tetratricopeptide (TPR) repeat protein
VGLKKRSIISFSIIAFAASFILMSNLFFSVGTFMNERFVFVASIFWCLAIVYLGVCFIEKRRNLKPLILLIGCYMLVFYPIKTVARNKAWKNDFTLFTTDVKTSKNSAKSNCSAGGKLWEEGKVTDNKNTQKEYYQLSEKYLRKAVKIHPTYTDAWILLGNVLYDSKKAKEEAASCYLNVLHQNPSHENARKNFDIVLQQEKNKTIQKKYYTELWNIDSADYTANYRLGVIYGRHLSDLPKGIIYLERAVKIAPNKAEAMKDLGTAYGMSGQIEKAYQTFKKAVKVDPNDDQIFYNLGVSCMQLGLKDEANEHFSIAAALKSSKNGK